MVSVKLRSSLFFIRVPIETPMLPCNVNVTPVSSEDEISRWNEAHQYFRIDHLPHIHQSGRDLG